MRARARLHFAKKILYLTYEKKTIEVPISTNGGPLAEFVEDHSESEEPSMSLNMTRKS